MDQKRIIVDIHTFLVVSLHIKQVSRITRFRNSKTNFMSSRIYDSYIKHVKYHGKKSRCFWLVLYLDTSPIHIQEKKTCSFRRIYILETFQNHIQVSLAKDLNCYLTVTWGENGRAARRLEYCVHSPLLVRI